MHTDTRRETNEMTGSMDGFSNEAAIGQVILQQLEIMNRQLDLFTIHHAGSLFQEETRKQTGMGMAPLPMAEIPETTFSIETVPPVPTPATIQSPGHAPVPLDPKTKERIPLTEAQREIWLASRISDTASCAFNESTVLHLKGPFSMAAMKNALQGLLHRYEALRTTFDDLGEYQHIHEPQTMEIPIHDYSSLQEPDQKHAVDELLKKEIQSPFDLAHGPVFRAQIMILSDAYHMVVITAHHIVCDGWSFDVMVRDLGHAYNILCEGRMDDRPLPSMQISDYALFHANASNHPEVLNTEAYWVRQFEDTIPTLDLPTDHPRPAFKTYQGAREGAVLEGETYIQIKKIGSRQGATLFSTLLTAFAVLLHRFTGQEDLVIGILAAGQSVVGSHDLVGHCTHLLPLRVRLSEDETFSELLARIQKSVLDAYDNQAVTFGRLIQRLKIKRDPSRTPLVSVMFNIDPAIHGMRFKDLDMEYLANPRCGYQFDMGFNLIAHGHKLVSECEYTTDLFEAGTIHRWLDHYHTLIAGIAENPNRRVWELPILSPSEKNRWLHALNETAIDYPRHKRLDQLFEEQACRTPEAMAVMCKGESLTYAELNRRVQQLARYLRKHHVGPDVLVGVCLERSVEMVVALLGVLRAGGAYLPMDPNFPRERLAFMLDDAAAPVLVTDSAVSEYFLDYPGTILRMDSDWPHIEQEGVGDLETIGTAEDLAYVIHTSGSTGKPKGVQIQHRAVVNFLWSMAREPGITSHDTVLSVTTVSFDIFGLELFLPLVTGARVVLAERHDVVDGTRLIGLLQESGATVMQATPATWRLLLQAGWKGSPSLNILCGGEALPKDLVGPLLERCKTFWNLYGPTETTIWSTLKRFNSPKDRITIGKPIANTQTVILDSHLSPVPIGVAGELFIGGDGLARGYLNRPELTAEKFIPNPFSQDPGSRLYRTGDLARQLANGELECLGRTDFQVKVRGFRVEPGEIETILNQHPSIKQSAVVVRPDASGENQLVAFAVTKEDPKPGVPDLKQHLRNTLPEYMVPSRVAFLEALPLTPNGKIDRKALLDISDAWVQDGPTAPVAATDPLEMQLLKIWESILKVKPIGIQDNFFDIGGHSLLAARLFARIERMMGIDLPLATLFQAPTIEMLAQVIRDKNWHAGWSSLVPIQPGGSNPALFFVHGAEGNVLLFRELAQQLGPDQPFYAFQSQGLSGTAPHYVDFENMAGHYLRELKSFQPEGPYHLGGYCLGGAIALEMARQLNEAGETVALLAMIETYNPHAEENPLPFFYPLWHWLQNLKFHWDNLWLLPNRDKITFLSKKWSTERSRIKIRSLIAFSRIARKLGLPCNESYPHVNITKINDLAHMAYIPKPYDGRITLFRPQKHYAGYLKADFGWGEIAQKGVEIHVLPMNPRGALVEPFVRTLAEEIRKCMAAIHAS